MSENQNSLVNGIAVIIDDKIGIDDDLINDLIIQIKSKNMPFLVYNELPSNAEVSHYHGISFIILDWRLHDIEGITIPDSVLKPSIDFLQEIKKTLCSCFYYYE